MAERVEAWWARRQWSKGRSEPYAVGTYREAWAAYPALIRQYHPELNAGITLTQIPPAADVLLLWECESGHRFAATPAEQRARPGRERRRSAWCPECAERANPTRILPLPQRETVLPPGALLSGPPAAEPGVLRERPARRPRPPARICDKTPAVPIGEAFVSACAPVPASAVEDRVRADLFARLDVTPGRNAVRVARPFFQHVEVWPDFLLPELRIAVEYDSIGRHGLEHVGAREEADRRKDRTLRASGWEVVRLRTGKLLPLGPHDMQLAAWNARALDRLIDVLRDLRGPLLVDAYLR
ncbi:zinc-ribbon domain-containing protein [Microbacterium sp. PA5]|uniref:zinc-ribbon domain-containing protein n=1 Tax=Microbacterium sp. PA5 TaxID=3416654 RepID=UPI003CF55BE7